MEMAVLDGPESGFSPPTVMGRSSLYQQPKSETKFATVSLSPQVIRQHAFTALLDCCNQIARTFQLAYWLASLRPQTEQFKHPLVGFVHHAFNGPDLLSGWRIRPLLCVPFSFPPISSIVPVGSIPCPCLFPSTPCTTTAPAILHRPLFIYSPYGNGTAAAEGEPEADPGTRSHTGAGVGDKRKQRSSASPSGNGNGRSDGNGKKKRETGRRRDGRRWGRGDGGGGGGGGGDNDKNDDNDADNGCVFFACPFYKKDPAKHSRCLHYRFTAARDVKRHLLEDKRGSSLHRQAIYCPRCDCVFTKNILRDAHLNEGSCTPPPDRKVFDGCSPEQVREINNLSHSHQRDLWTSIWRILFPGVPPPLSPYLNAEEVNLISRPAVWGVAQEELHTSLQEAGFPAADVQIIDSILETVFRAQGEQVQAVNYEETTNGRQRQREGAIAAHARPPPPPDGPPPQPLAPVPWNAAETLADTAAAHQHTSMSSNRTPFNDGYSSPQPSALPRHDTVDLEHLTQAGFSHYSPDFNQSGFGPGNFGQGAASASGLHLLNHGQPNRLNIYNNHQIPASHNDILFPYFLPQLMQQQFGIQQNSRVNDYQLPAGPQYSVNNMWLPHGLYGAYGDAWPRGAGFPYLAPAQNMIPVNIERQIVANSDMVVNAARPSLEGEEAPSPSNADTYQSSSGFLPEPREI